MSMIFEMLNEQMEEETKEIKQLLLKLYFYLKNKIHMEVVGESCQECGCSINDLEIVELFNYVEKYFQEEIKNNVAINK